MVRKKAPSKQSLKKKETEKKGYETLRRALVISEEQKREMEKEIPTMKVITPSVVAQKYGIRVSIAKAILAELEARKLIKRVTGTGRFKLYTKASA